MPRISATGTERGSRTGTGFTLIEVLVVVAIAGVLVALASVNLFPSDEQIARREAGTVALAVEHARDAAWFGGRPSAITFDQGAVQEWRLAGREWQLQQAHRKALAPELKVTGLFVDGQPLPPNERLVFLPDGLGIPFRVALDVRGRSWAVEGDSAGAISMAQR